ncbi:MAG: HlyC/CorC family transporter [Deltaproteobacteria bacterium]|nr:HlyC/CorC family transporter [Deltaproteobacteria bacterium]
MHFSIKLTLLAVLLLLSGFFSSSETAFFSLSRVRLRRRKIIRDRDFKYVLRLLRNPSAFLTTVLIGNEIVNISISVFTVGLVYSLAHDILGPGLLPFVSMLITVPALLLFGEIIPKTIAVKFPERTAKINAPVMYLFAITITPLRILLSAASRIFISFFVKDPTKHPPDSLHINEDIFKSMVDISSREGQLEPGERDLIHRVFKLDDIPVARIMTPRESMVAVALDSSEEAFRQVVEKEKFSRYPAYESNPDHITGFVHAKDLLRLTPPSRKKPQQTIRGILRRPTFIPEDADVLSAFLLLKKNKTHISIVFNSSGTTAGIVTMEDIMEELFGEIRDETDMEGKADA